MRTPRCIFFFSLLICLAVSAPLFAQTTYTWNGSANGTWSTTTNWTPNGVPGSLDTADITSGDPQLTANVTVGSLSITGSAYVDLHGWYLTVNNSVTLGSSWAPVITSTGGPGSPGPGVNAAGAEFNVASGGAVTLQANSTIIASGTGPGGGSLASVTINGTVDGAYLLGITTSAKGGTASGAITLGAAVGSSTPLSSISLHSSSAAPTPLGTISVQAVTTSNSQTYSAATSTTVNGTLLVNTAGYGVGFTGAVALAGSGGTITLTGTNASNNVSFSSTVDGGRPLAVTARGGTVSFSGAVGGTTSLASLSVSASTTTASAGITTANGAVSLKNDALTFTTINSGSGLVTIAPLSSSTAINIGSGASGGLAVTQTELDNITSSGGLTIGATSDFAVLTLVSGGLDLTLGPGSLSGGTLTLAGGSLVANGVTISGALKSPIAVSVTESIFGSIDLNANITTTGEAVNFTGPVRLSAGVTVDTTNGGGSPGGSTVVFSPTSTINGAYALTVDGASTFNTGVGMSTALASLNVNGVTTIYTTGITTTGTQTYNGAATFGAGGVGNPKTLTMTASTIAFTSTFDGTIAGVQSVSIAGNASFGGMVGGIVPFVTLSTSGTTAVNASGVTTSSSQTYTGAVTLGSSVTLTTTNSSVTFGTTVDAASAGAYSLTLALGTGTASAGGAIGGTGAIGNLTISSGTLALGGYNLTATGNVTVNGTLDASSGTSTITVGGNWTTGGTFTAGSSTVVFDGATAVTLTSGGSSFYNLKVSGGTSLTTLDALTVASGGTLTINAATDSLNVQGNNFSINKLSFNNADGTFFLTGAQAQQSITTLDTTNGTITYNGSSSNTVALTVGGSPITTFYNLTIDKATGATLTLANAITVLNDLWILQGTLDVSASSYGITVGNQWNRAGGPYGSFTERSGTVTLSGGSNTFTVSGSNTFYDFVCTSAGAAINFEALKTQTIAPGGTFQLTGTSASPIVLHSTVPGSSTNRWYFDLQTGPPAATLSMSYVDVYDSDASAHPIITPPTVSVGTGNPSTFNDLDWIFKDAVTGSQTADFNGDGKIDAIVVTVTAQVDNNFSGFDVSVPGYSVAGFRGYGQPAKYAGEPAPATNQFYIYLTEGSSLDTSVTPAWSIVSNTTLYDTSGQDLVVFDLSTYPSADVAADKAPPIVAYTLAVAGQDQVLVDFSEPVVNSGGSPLTTANFSYLGAAPTSVSLLQTSGNGASEALLTFGSPIAASDVINQTSLTVSNVTDMAASPNPLWGTGASPDITHRITDIGLGLSGQGIVQPVYADNPLQAAAFGGGGAIYTFDGSQRLQAQSISIQGEINSGYPSASVGGLSVSIAYDSNVSSSLESGNLWLPPFTTTQVTSPAVTASAGFTGIVPAPDASAQSVTTAADTSNPYIRDGTIPASSPPIRSGATLGFFFVIAPTGTATEPLICANITNPSASNWYDSIQPWELSIENVATQRSGVTILNNVIDPNQGEKTDLVYTIASGGSVTINVFDLAGDLVNTLFRGELSPGQYSTSWDGRDFGGRAVARGIYLIRVVAPGIDEFRKVLVVK